MKMFMLKVMMAVAMTTTMMKTPMSMGILLLIQTMFSIIIMNMMFYTSWFPMITFLMMIGGLLIIFMYMSSIASNEKFKMNLKLLLLTMIILIYTEEMLFEFQMNEESNLNMKLPEELSMAKMYNKTMMMTMMMVMYLLLTMMSINKIIKHFQGPLRASTYE